MAKTKRANSVGGTNKAGEAKAEKKASPKKSFEERLERLEELGDEIRKTDIPLEDAIKAFEEGIKLARDLERELEKVESRVEIVMNGMAGDAEDDDEAGGTRADEGPVLGLFDDEE
jgi:exodeoxyribonuclease VII small subunit